MPPVFSRHRRLASRSGLSVALIAACLLPAASHAGGFSGSFAPANWSIVNTTDGTVDQTLVGAGTPPQYTCLEVNDVACAETIDATNGSVDVVGSITGFSGGGSGNTLRTTTWSVTNGAQASLLSFDWALATNATDATNQSASYLIGATEIFLSSLNGNSGSLSNISLAAGETFGFRVTTSDNTGDSGVLSITNFTATSAPASVPGPLPLAGGAAAFCWSRRLRGRLRKPRA